MSDLDWSAWVAIKAAAEAVAREKAFTPAEIEAVLATGKIPIEMTKGIPGSFRAWDRQLRQPIMLHTADAVIDFAPLEGFLAEQSTLDTLGLSERDVPCKPK
jgi:ABC transporter substrate binding protein (PQQ-dependent alcohol dehydrogenase system)